MLRKHVDYHRRSKYPSGLLAIRLNDGEEPQRLQVSNKSEQREGAFMAPNNRKEIEKRKYTATSLS